MNPETRREVIEDMDSAMKDFFAGLNPEAQEEYLDDRLYMMQLDAAERALAGWEGRAPIPPEIMAVVEHAVEWLVAREYPLVWVGEERTAPVAMLALQKWTTKVRSGCG